MDILSSHSGYIHLKEKRYFSYDFVNGELIIHVHSAIPEIEGNNMIYVQRYDNKCCLLYSQVVADFSVCH